MTQCVPRVLGQDCVSVSLSRSSVKAQDGTKDKLGTLRPRQALALSWCSLPIPQMLPLPPVLRVQELDSSCDGYGPLRQWHDPFRGHRIQLSKNLSSHYFSPL